MTFSADKTLVQPRRPISVVLGRFEDLTELGLKTLIDQDGALSLVAQGIEPDALDRVLSDVRPSVAIINLGTLTSPADVHRMSADHPGTRILVLGNRPSASEANQLLAFGAAGYLSKATQGRDILNAIHLASRGMQIMPAASPSFSNGVDVGGIGPELLTPREADVLRHLQENRSNAEIAYALSVGIETVRTHRRNIYRKLGVKTRRELGSLSGPPPAMS